MNIQTFVKDRAGHEISPETRAKMSASHMGNTNLLGHHHSEESRAKMSAAHMGQLPWNKGIEMSEEVCLINRLAHLGLHHSEETKAKMSVAQTGNTNCLGTHHSEETRAKLSAMQMGNHWKGGPQFSKRRSYAKRRSLGYVYLNAPFAGCEGHHVDNEQVIHMPKPLHRSVYHRQRDSRGMAQINAIAYNFLFKQEVEAAMAKVSK